MKTLFFLFWLLVPPVDSTDQAALSVQQEPTLEQCQKDGQKLYEQSQAMVDAKKLDKFYGACVPAEANDGKDARGSI